jgi:Fic family protein
MDYFWQQVNFPDFQFEIADFISQIQEFAKEFGEVNGLLVNVTEENKKSILLHILVSEAIKTSEIRVNILAEKISCLHYNTNWESQK